MHAAIAEVPGLAVLGSWRDEDVVVEVWEKGDRVTSVARREGLV